MAGIVAVLVLGTGGQVQAQELELEPGSIPVEPGRTIMEIVVGVDGTTEMTCYPDNCDALCRTMQTLCSIQSGRFFRIDNNCSCNETDGTIVEQAMIETLELLGVLGPLPGGPAEGLQLNPFSGITRESIRTIEVDETDMEPQFEGQVGE